MPLKKREPSHAGLRRAGGVWALACLTLLAPAANAQTGSEMRQILDRLDQLEAQNRSLLEKVDALQAQLASAQAAANPQTPQVSGPAPAATQADLAERVAAQEARTAEQQQTKVEASQKFPIRITGMALFNAYRNSESSGGYAFPTAAATGGASGGATFRQTVIGLDYFGPQTFGGGKISGSVVMDFFGGSGQSLDQLLRLRTADIAIDWRDRSFRVALDKSLLSLREPESLAQVGLPALTGAGNLWYWIPQARVEQVVHFTDSIGLRADVAAVGTVEASPIAAYGYTGSPGTYSASLNAARPGVEARAEFFSGSKRRIEIAPAIHHSVAHDAGASLPTNIYSLDWLVRASSAFEFSGAAFSGTNLAALGGLQQGAVVYGSRAARAIHSQGGWGQLKWRPAPRLWFNIFTGEEAPDTAGLPRNAIRRNLAYGANVFYRIAPNVLASFEAHQYRTSYIPTVTLLSNHYDLALAYQF